MQSLNVITDTLLQGTDLQSKGNFEQSYNHDEKASFSHLVNQHITEEKRTSANKTQSKIENTHSAVSRKTLAASEYEEQKKTNQQDTDQAISKSEISKQADHLIVEEKISENSKLSALEVATEDEVSENNDTSQYKDNSQVHVVESQHSPEQFINLLYISDKTLTSSTLASNVSITQADTNTNKHLSDFDLATVNPLKTKSIENQSAKSEVTEHIKKNTIKLNEASIQYLVEEKNSLSSIDKAVKKIPEDSTIGKKLSQPTSQAFLVGTVQLKSKTITKPDEVKPQTTLNVNSDLGSDTSTLTSKYSLNKNSEVFSPEKQFDKTTEGLSFKELVNSDKKIVPDDFATQTLAVKLSNKQNVQGLTQKTEQILTNNVLPDKKNQADSNQVSSPPTQQAESDIIDDALGLRLANMAKNSQGEAVTTDQKNTNPIKSQSKTSQPENLTKDLALKNKIITENSFYDVNALEPNDKNTEKEFSVANHTVIRSENLSQKIIKNSAEQSQKTVTDEEHLKENSEESTSSEIDNILSNVEKPKLARPVNVFSDNASSRLAQELQFQTGQTTHNKQSNEAYMAHQASEALNHNIASDTAHIQKNNVQLQQETIAIFRKDFADAVKDKVLVMINQKLQKFEITLDPPEFGNMQVRVNLQGEQASVNFIVQNQQAKEAIEQNMQKLKDMLSEQGVDVGGANVEQQDQREQNDQRNNFASGELINDKLMSEAETQQVFSANIYDISETAIDYYA